jgi:hypothetical protein
MRLSLQVVHRHKTLRTKEGNLRNMTKKEKTFVAALLRMACDRFSCHMCNDLPEELRKHFTDEEWTKINLKAAQWNEHTDTPKEITEIKWYDWCCMSYFASVLETEDD